MTIVKYTSNGLLFSVWFKCGMCGMMSKVDKEDDDPTKMDLNLSAVSSSIAAGIGYKHLSTVLGGMNMPCFADKTFIKLQNEVYRGWETSVPLKLMNEAAEEEKKAALERGDVDPRDRVPLIKVIADGCWSKRSYRSGYTALCGVGAIIGFHTRKVLFIGSKNKYCVVCSRAENAEQGL